MGRDTRGIALFDPALRTATVLPLGENEDPGLADADVRSMLSARDGRLWLGTAFNGVARFDAPTDRWQILRADSGSPRLSSNTVLALHQDQERPHLGRHAERPGHDRRGRRRARRIGRIRPIRDRWPATSCARSTKVLTARSGSARSSASTARRHRRRAHALHALAAARRLPNGTIGAIGEDAMGRLWLSTSKGLAAFDRSTEHSARSTRPMVCKAPNSTTAHLRRCATAGWHSAASTVSRCSRRKPSSRAAIRRRSCSPASRSASGIGRCCAARTRCTWRKPIASCASSSPRSISPRPSATASSTGSKGSTALDRRRRRHEATYTNLDAGRYVSLFAPTNHDGYWNEATGNPRTAA